MPCIKAKVWLRVFVLQLRNMILEILNRLPNNDVLKVYMKQLLHLSSEILAHVRLPPPTRAAPGAWPSVARVHGGECAAAITAPTTHFANTHTRTSRTTKTMR